MLCTFLYFIMLCLLVIRFISFVRSFVPSKKSNNLKVHLATPLSYLRFFYLLYLEEGFLSAAYPKVDNLDLLEISINCQVLVRSPYLVYLFSFWWITGGYAVHRPINLPQLVLKSRCSEIRPPNQLDYRQRLK